MDYSGFNEFPFPSSLTDDEHYLKGYFMSLSDDEQLGLLGGCASYAEFRGRVAARAEAANARR